jgi:hypothetical protein
MQQVSQHALRLGLPHFWSRLLIVVRLGSPGEGFQASMSRPAMAALYSIGKLTEASYGEFDVYRKT